MPKNSNVEVLRRWRDMDAWLAGRLVGKAGGRTRRGLSLRYFARKWGVSARTVVRDLIAFQSLGQELWKQWERWG